MSSSEERDPFPMQSKEAAVLASSIDASSKWDRMSTSSPLFSKALNSTADGHSVTSSQRESLTGAPPKNKSENPYDDLDAEDREEAAAEDDYLERPMGSPSRKHAGLLVHIRENIRVAFVSLYGDDIDMSELRRVLFLSLTLFFMIGGYWLLRSLKDPVLASLCGVESIPKAKMLSVFVVLGVVSIYNKLLDSDIPKHKLFFIFGMFYFVLFAGVAFLLADRNIGLANEKPDPWRILGWVSYCGIESFGSVMVSLFWSFANSNISLESAKAGYGFMVATAQIGSILGPTVVAQYSESAGVPACYFIGALCMLLLQVTMYAYVQIYGVSKTGQASSTASKDKPKAGILEGLVLFWEHNYIKGIFAISCLFMIEVTIVDFTMKVLAKEHFSNLHPCIPGNSCWDDVTNTPIGLSADALATFSAFMGFFGQATNTLSLIMSLFGTSAIIRSLGLRTTLMLFPSLCLGVIVFVRYNPTLWDVFGAMILLKGFSYALNNPTKEILYQPTSSAVKYKAKSWIDIFGARGSKALGSVVTNAFSDSAEHLIANGSLVGIAVSSFLIFNARYMGKKFDLFTSTGYVVGEDIGEHHELIQMAMAQNDVQDTSCGIEDDDEIDELEEGQGIENSDAESEE